MLPPTSGILGGGPPVKTVEEVLLAAVDVCKVAVVVAPGVVESRGTKLDRCGWKLVSAK